MIHHMKKNRGQTAIEYLLLLALVAGVVFLGMETWLERVRDGSDGYYNSVVGDLVGPPPPSDLSSY